MAFGRWHLFAHTVFRLLDQFPDASIYAHFPNHRPTGLDLLDLERDRSFLQSTNNSVPSVDWARNSVSCYE